MKFLVRWLDDRTGCRELTRLALEEPVPGGSRWRYVWGSALTFLFIVQIITGVFLWMAYSPSANHAWESVHYIQHEMAGGWLVRGIHHFAAQAMVVLMVIHLLQVIIDGAYRPPREFNFWIGLILMALILGLSLTGYLLPWDQKGYWATKVATSLAAVVPVAGPEIQKLVVGGDEYGHLTLTRFFALHAGVLPGLVIVFVVIHLYLFRRHGLTAKQPLRGPTERFWPDQLLKDVIACAAVLAIVVAVVLYERGAPLGAPADPSEPYDAARPEWYFLFLFQLLKYFPGESEIWGAIYLPGLIAIVFVLMPLIGRWRMGHRLNVAAVFAMVGVAGVLTVLAKWDDLYGPRSAEYAAAVALAEHDATRVMELAGAPTGIDPRGAVALLREDPLTQGPKLFAMHCASCHRYDGHDGLGRTPADEPSAPDLHGFAGRQWLTGLLDPAHIATPAYFGNTAFADGDMVRTVKRFDMEDEEEVAEIRLIVNALSAEAKLPSQAAIEAAENEDDLELGRELIGPDGFDCTQCHRFHGQGSAKAPDLTGYGSRQWTIDFIANPAHERFYGEKNDRMPAYLDDTVLTPQQIALIVDWLRGEWYTAPAPAE